MPPVRRNTRSHSRGARSGRRDTRSTNTSLSPAPEVQPYARQAEARGAMQRRIISLEEENARLQQILANTPRRSYVREGRAIRRLVCLTEPVSDLIAEYDRRVMLAEDSSKEVLDAIDSTDIEKRTYNAYNELLEWCPSVRGIMQGATDGYMLSAICQELKRGADNARGDDANNLKARVAMWLNKEMRRPETPLIPDEKGDRGFNHEVTGRLLCPVDFNWCDENIRHAIRYQHSLYPVTAYSWPAFLYKNGQCDLANTTVGLFKGGLLVRAFKCIFTSPSSARKDPEEENDDPNDLPSGSRSRKSRKTRRCVAEILNMRAVHPRAIAYVAVQLRFALSSVDSWDIRDNIFDYQVFYNNIINWFEEPGRAGDVEQLLQWWNRMVFGRRRTTPLQADEINNLSVALSMRLNMA